ncbi:FG-GAP repeat protein, partial [Aliivibrio sifiae]
MKNFIILALACSLFACNSENSGLPTQVGGNYQPESFNFHEILSVDGNVKTYFFEWEDSSNASYYTLCEKNNSYKDNCNIIQDNLKGLSTQYELSRLLTPKFLDKEFFIIARNGNNIKLSNVRSVNQDEYLKSIGVVKSSNAKDNDYFGRSVSFSEDGNTLAIGAFGVDGSKGKVYIYQKKDNLWEQRVELSPDDLEAGDRFGISNAISKNGKTLVVGADHNHNNNVPLVADEPGKAYVYHNVADSWVFDRILTRGVNDDSFGSDISISDNGSTIAIASPHENNDIGNVYLYT